MDQSIIHNNMYAHWNLMIFGAPLMDNLHDKKLVKLLIAVKTVAIRSRGSKLKHICITREKSKHI